MTEKEKKYIKKYIFLLETRIKKLEKNMKTLEMFCDFSFDPFKEINKLYQKHKKAQLQKK